MKYTKTKIFACVTLFAAGLFFNQRVNAFDSEALVLPSIAAFTTGSAAVIAGTGGAATPVVLTIGAVAVGASLMYVAANYLLDKAVQVLISPADTNQTPNADLPTATVSVPVGSFNIPTFNSVSYPFLYLPATLPAAGGPDYIRFISRLTSQFITLGYSPVFQTGPYWSLTSATADPGYCTAAKCIAVITYTGMTGATYAYSSGTCPTGIVCRVSGSPTLSQPGNHIIYIPMVFGTPSDCPSGSTFNADLSSCLSSSASLSSILDDGVCRISWSASSGNAIYSPFDPDCARLVARGVLQTVPNTNSSVSPSVTLTDPATGKVTKVVRPMTTAQATAQGVPAKGLDILTYAPNNATGTTSVGRTTTTPTTNTSAPATSVGSSQNVYQGNGVPAANATPVQNVVVDNFPTTQTVTCSNCTTAAPIVNVGAPVINIPDTVKLNPEGYSAADLPDGTANLAALGDVDFLAALKAKLNPFSSFVAPTGAGVCPTSNYSWSNKLPTGNTFSWQVNSTQLCDTLESAQVKSIVQGAMLLIFSLIAIRTVLDA